MTKQEIQFQNRMIELANMAWQRDIPIFTNFLERNELHILHSTKDFQCGIRIETFGGYEFAERQMAVFLPDAPFLQYDYPFVTVKIAPLHPKYAESLSHRDFLGAILNLGIDRSQLGDLIVKDASCIAFCTPQIGTFLIDNCCRIRHTDVFCELIETNALDVEPNFIERKGSVSSVRLDSVLALAFHSSRSSIITPIQNGEVFINSRIATGASQLLKDGDVISARGYGKFIFDGVLSGTKKGRLMVQLRIFD